MPHLANQVRALVAIATLLGAPALFGETRAALPLEGFADGIQHWAKAHGADYARLAPDDLEAIATNLLRYQRANGGWRENDDPLRLLPAEERATIAATRDLRDTSFDNSATCPQIAYLAGAYHLTGNVEYRAAALRGLEFVFTAQHAVGAWPHSYPETAAYRGLLTFADSVTPNVLRLLRQVAAGAEPFTWADPALRARARLAIARGDAAVLRLQIRQNGRLTGWAGQYDPATLAPAQGRAFELPAIVSRETVEVLRYLATIENPSPETVAAVESGARWLRESALYGW
ncbi:MAG TPA: pectate lyase, partial [Opitutaceae bacterium]|nr:pectate lyase [Opitutaceae bacterium]